MRLLWTFPYNQGWKKQDIHVMLYPTLSKWTKLHRKTEHKYTMKAINRSFKYQFYCIFRYKLQLFNATTLELVTSFHFERNSAHWPVTRPVSCSFFWWHASWVASILLLSGQWSRVSMTMLLRKCLSSSAILGTSSARCQSIFSSIGDDRGGV